jgi:hypothetical protein
VIHGFDDLVYSNTIWPPPIELRTDGFLDIILFRTSKRLDHALSTSSIAHQPGVSNQLSWALQQVQILPGAHFSGACELTQLIPTQGSGAPFSQIDLQVSMSVASTEPAQRSIHIGGGHMNNSPARYDTVIAVDLC